MPRMSVIQRICVWLKIQTKNIYYIKNIEGLAEKDITDNLKFEVSPNRQGLVGECYEQKAILYDDDLENSNEINYNLTHYQIAKTNQLKFILVSDCRQSGSGIYIQEPFFFYQTNYVQNRIFVRFSFLLQSPFCRDLC